MVKRTKHRKTILDRIKKQFNQVGSVAIPRRGSTSRILRKEQMQLQSMVLPGIIFILIFMYIPMWGLVIAFQDFNVISLQKGIIGGVMNSEWVGFKHFISFFQARDFANIMKNTIGISVLRLIFGFPAPIILALMLNEIGKGKGLFQTITYLPHFVSWVIVSGILMSLLNTNNGSVNMLLVKLGFIDEPVNWLSKKEYFWGILISANIWKEMGFNAIIYLAAISGIDQQLYEAAACDGASKIKQIFVITLPCIAPQIIILLILQISRLLNAGFEDILLLTNNGQNAALRSVSEVIDTYVFRMGIQQQRYSYSAAAGLSKAIVNFMLLFSANAISRRISETSLW